MTDITKPRPLKNGSTLHDASFLKVNSTISGDHLAGFKKAVAELREVSRPTTSGRGFLADPNAEFTLYNQIVAGLDNIPNDGSLSFRGMVEITENLKYPEGWEHARIRQSMVQAFAASFWNQNLPHIVEQTKGSRIEPYPFELYAEAMKPDDKEVVVPAPRSRRAPKVAAEGTQPV